MRALKVAGSNIYEGSCRLDASYYLSDGVLAQKYIKKNFKTDCLKDISMDIFSGLRFKRNYVKDGDEGILFLGGNAIKKIDLSKQRLLSKKHTKGIPKLLLQPAWTLITRSGTIGLTAYTGSHHCDSAASEDVIRVCSDSKKVLPGYVYAFFSSEIGYALLTQGTFGAVIQHIEPHQVQKILIPRIDEKLEARIHDLIEKSSELRALAATKLREATDYFDKMFDYNVGYQQFFLKNITDLNFSLVGRNNDIFAENIISEIKKKNGFTIKSKAQKYFAPPMFKHIYLKKNNNFPFFKGAELLKNFRKPELYLSMKGVKDINDYIVNRGDLLIYKSGPRDGMLGSVFIADRSMVPSIFLCKFIKSKQMASLG